MQISKSRLKQIIKEELLRIDEGLSNIEQESQVNDMFADISSEDPSLDKIQEICNKLEGFGDSIRPEYIGNEIEIRLEEIRKNIISAANLIRNIAQTLQEEEY